VLKLLDATADRASIMANRLLALVRKLFNWSQERGYIEVSPCAGIKAPSKERTRERVLRDDDLCKLWPAFEALGYPSGRYSRCS
jgi:site-specific recombinase XerC